MRAAIAGQRQQYFEESNKRRALRQATANLHVVRPKLRTRPGGESQAEAIAQCFRQDPVDDTDRHRKVVYIKMLVAYLKGTQQSTPTCFICTGKDALKASGSTNKSHFDCWQEVGMEAHQQL